MSDPKDIVAPVEVVDAVLKAVEPKAKTDDVDPSWLNARLERERTSMLKKLGFETVEEGQASSAELKAKREAEKTAADKAAETALLLKKEQTEKKAMAEALSGYATLQLVGLSPEQKAAVALIAGDDPAQQLKAIAALQPTWAKAEPTKAEPKSVDTAPAANAPAPTTTSEVNHKAQYAALQKTNPFAAAAYGLAHASDVFGT